MHPRRFSAPQPPAEATAIVEAGPGADELRRQESGLRRAKRARRAAGPCNQAPIDVATEGGLLAEVCRVIGEEGGCRLAWAGYAKNDARKNVRPAACAGQRQL